jgi:predicted transposase/invertase (TIGR01784 family)
MVCGFPVFDDEDLIHKFCYTDGKRILSDICTIIYVELPKIQKLLKQDFAGLSKDEQWALFIENIDKKEFAEKVMKQISKEEFRVAVNTLSGISKSREEQIRYLSRLKFQKDLIHSRSVAKGEGLEEGLQQGIEKGIRKGVLDTALNFLKMGLPPEQVASGTKLSLAEVEELQKQL